jgi:hypothetical protein
MLSSWRLRVFVSPILNASPNIYEISYVYHGIWAYNYCTVKNFLPLVYGDFMSIPYRC